MLNFIWHDEETQNLLLEFAKAYIKAQHLIELIETGFGIVTEIAIGLLIAAFTLGAGATVAVASKVRHADKLGRLGKVLIQLAKRLKQNAGSKQTTSRTGKWLDQRLEKPENRKIEKGAVGEGVASHGPDIGTTVRAGTSGPDKILRFTAEQADGLKGLARTEFEQLIAAKQAGHLTNAELGPALSVAQDLRTGQISRVWRNNPVGEAPVNLSETLARRWADAPDEVLAFERTHGMASHSEIYAVDELLKVRPDASLNDFTVFTIETRIPKYRADFKPACRQCNWLLEGVQYVK